MRHPTLAFLAVILGLVGLGALGYFISTRPTTLRIAVGPVGNENVRVVSAAIQTFQRERESFRLRMVLTEGSEQSAKALDEGKADLAVLRPDISYPRTGSTVAVMHVDHVVIVAPGGTGIKSIADLKGKAVAVFRENPGNIRVFRIIAAQAGLGEEDVKVERLRLADMRTALETRKIDAVMSIAPITGRQLLDVVNTVAEAGYGEVSFLPVVDNKAIELRYPLLDADTLVRGLFGGVLPRPAEDIHTLTVSHLLLASRNLSDATISDFTRVILNSKSQIAAEAPLASRIEAPDQEKESPIPIHNGTITYLDGQTSTFLERYGDWFYIGLMGLGIGGSGLAGYFSWATARARRGTMYMLGDLQKLIVEARTASQPAQLTTLSQQADAIFNRIMTEAIDNNLDASATLTFNMAFAQVRDAISERQKVLMAEQDLAEQKAEA
jgi:TRAP transporter TAXI family solute receptor